MSKFEHMMQVNMSRRAFVAGLGSVAAAATSLLAGCGGQSSTPAAGSDAAPEAGDAIKVCFVEIVENGAFTSMMDGFKSEMENLGYTNVTYDIENAQGDSDVMNQIAANLKTSDYDLIAAIATPSAQACVNAEIEIPMVFISVTDPVGAGLLSDMDHPDKGITGTSDFIPASDVYDFGVELLPAAAEKPAGLLYCSASDAAVGPIESIKEYFDANGIAYEERAVSNSSEVQQAATTLAQSCGCIYVPQDTVIQDAMPVAVEAGLEAGVPIFGSDPVMTRDGALVSIACGNEVVGQYSAQLADQLLSGASAADVPAVRVQTVEKHVNQTTAEALGVEIPDDPAIVLD